MDLERNGMPRVVITGLSAITALGGTAQETWEKLKAGVSGIRRITSIDTSCLGVKVAGEIEYDLAARLEPKEMRRMSRDSQLAVVTARDALADAGLSNSYLETIPERVGVSIGTTLGGYEIGIKQVMPFPQTRIGPFALLNSLPNLPGYYISREMHAEGPSLTISTACASSTQSIGEGAGMIKRGLADVVFAGGVEGLVQECLIAGLEAMGVMATGYENNPTEASRPFDADRRGLVFSEGVAIMVLESLKHALARGARIYAEVLGYAASTDISSPAIPDSTGKPARQAMSWALADAHLPPDVVDYINPHGPGTKGDATETLAIKQVFCERAYKIPVSSTKSMLGHPMGGAGAVEAMVCTMTIADGVIHPTINYQTPDPECDLDYVPNQAREAKVRVAMSNSFGLGGQNATVLLGAI